MNEYTTKPAGLFHAILTEATHIWAYCPVCWDRTEQVFDHEDELKEYYICTGCNCIHEIVVR